MPNKVKAALIGCGGMARHHMRQILKQEDTEFVVLCEPSEAAYIAMSEVFIEAGLEPPPNQPSLPTLLASEAANLDAVFIITPHVFHFEQAKACLEAGLDVLLEKPMVMNASEAEALIQVQKDTGRLLVVAFNGSLSPRIRRAVSMLRSGELGRILNVHAVVWQNWKLLTTGAWRQIPEIAGGGFLFDTGAHLLNTVSDLLGENYTDVTAWLDNRGTQVDILGSVMARTESGVLVTLNGCGEAIKSCHSDVRVFCEKAILRTGVWGEQLEIQYDGDAGLTELEVEPSMGSWEQFLKVRRGEIANPCPPQVGLRMAKLWDAIQASAAQDGMPIRLRD
ncbi:MAG: Gfo/Idh/MocA family oxidoreductase [Trueperaceae bacterium]|nr:Gfo/Idh/MocA family oxidoreductase [Trueperaceae bacterium]